MSKKLTLEQRLESGFGLDEVLLLLIPHLEIFLEKNINIYDNNTKRIYKKTQNLICDYNTANGDLYTKSIEEINSMFPDEKLALIRNIEERKIKMFKYIFKHYDQYWS